MFNFLNPTILIAATAALIPLIIHLFSKRRVKIVEFSSLKHLKAMQKRQVRRLKIRQLLLLILRMLILLAIVLAFARPTLQSGGIGSHASVSAVLLFDNSASMNREVSDGNLFELSQKRALQIIDTFGESDEVCVIPLDQSENRIKPKFSSSAVAKDQLSRLTNGSSIAELQESLELANDLLKNASNLNKELYIISDQQRVSLPDSSVLENCDAKIYLVEIPIEELAGIALNFLLNQGSDVKAVNKEYRVVNGNKVLFTESDATISGIKVTYLTYYYSNSRGSSQLIAFTGRKLADKYESEIFELLNGLIVQ